VVCLVAHRKAGILQALRVELVIAAGCFDNPTDFELGKHIYTASKGDYYGINDEVPSFEEV